jgi:hypothetical protein
LDTGCDNDSRNNATIKREVKEEIITDENHVHSENNEEQRFVLIFGNSVFVFVCVCVYKTCVSRMEVTAP